jgi:hypothetical protein
MRTLEEIFNEAVEHKATAIINGDGYEARLLYGIRISRDNKTQEIVIEDSTSSGDYYRELNDEDYQLFLDNSWKYGVYVLSLNNLRRKLDLIEIKIGDEISSRNNEKYIKQQIQSRDNVLNRYATINNKLTKLNQV